LPALKVVAQTDCLGLVTSRVSINSMTNRWVFGQGEKCLLTDAEYQKLHQ
jgi:hypothetical protein